MSGLLCPAAELRSPRQGSVRIHFALRIVLSVVLPSVLPRAFDDGEASPSPVYGARLLSGLRAQPSRGFKSRRLRHLWMSQDIYAIHREELRCRLRTLTG